MPFVNNYLYKFEFMPKLNEMTNNLDTKSVPDNLLKFFNKLLFFFGQQHWWPAETEFEVIIGAILTQNTAWANVEKAISALKEKSMLTPDKLRAMSQDEIASYIKPSGYFNQKSKKIKIFLDFFHQSFSSDMEKMRNCDSQQLRESLLNLFGIGRETADSILLYALGKPYFVVDAYTRRIFSRHNFITESENYESIRSFFEQNLERNTYLYEEFHALIVKTGSLYCKKKPLCDICPLKEFL